MNTGLKRLLAALPALCMLIALTACGGSQALSKEEYEEAVIHLGEDVAAIQEEFASLNLDNTDKAVNLLEEAKAPLQAFMALTPPDIYASAPVKLTSGSQAMVDYVDLAAAMINESDLSVIQQQAQEMLELLQTASQDLAEGTALLDKAAGISGSAEQQEKEG